jgi:hypothetical protein
MLAQRAVTYKMAQLGFATLLLLLLPSLLLLPTGQPLGLLQDASSGAVQLWSSDALHEVTMSNEDKDMWRIYLEHQVGQLLAVLLLFNNIWLFMYLNTGAVFSLRSAVCIRLHSIQTELTLAACCAAANAIIAAPPCRITPTR